MQLKHNHIISLNLDVFCSKNMKMRSYEELKQCHILFNVNFMGEKTEKK